MAREREVRKETDFWGNEKEVIYEDNRRVGEIRTEERGGFLGIGAESVRVEYDNDGHESSYTKQEERGGFLGIGAEPVEVRCDPSDKEVGHSRVEERGGFLSLGTHHVRVEYDNAGREISQTNHERRGGFLGIGDERVRVTRYNDREDGAPSAGGSARRSSEGFLGQHPDKAGGTRGSTLPSSARLRSGISSAPVGAAASSGVGWIVLLAIAAVIIGGLSTIVLRPDRGQTPDASWSRGVQAESSTSPSRPLRGSETVAAWVDGRWNGTWGPDTVREVLILGQTSGAEFTGRSFFQAQDGSISGRGIVIGRVSAPRVDFTLSRDGLVFHWAGNVDPSGSILVGVFAGYSNNATYTKQ